MRILFGLFLTTVVAAASCGPDTPVKPLLSDIQARIFNVSCTFSSCHSVDGHKGDLVLVTGQSRDNLINVPAKNTEARRLMKLRVVAGNPDASFMFHKVNRSGAKFCTAQQLLDEDPTCEGEAMPSENERLPQQRVEAIRQWIADGALNN